ncbi:hypothetical protein [Solidesulfovibrio sp.]
MATTLTFTPASSGDTGFLPAGSPSPIAGEETLFGWHPAGICGAFVRFPVSVPRDATIISAHVRFRSVSLVSVDTVNATLAFLDADDVAQPTTAAEVTGAAHTAGVDWPAIASTDHDAAFDSPELSVPLQELVNRTGWVSGNHAILHIQDDGSTQSGAYRAFYGVNTSEHIFPQLIVEFEDASPTQTTNYYTENEYGKAFYEQIDPALSFTTILYAGDGLGFQYTGLVRIPINLPQGAQIESAHLRLVSRGNPTGEVVNLAIRLVDLDNAPKLYDPDIAGSLLTKADIVDLPKTSSVAWPGVPVLEYRETVNSPDISALVQGVIDKTGWVTGNSILVVLENTASTEGAYRVFCDFQAIDGLDYGSSLVVEHAPANADTFAAGVGALPVLSSPGSWSASVFPSSGYLPSQVINLLSPNSGSASSIDTSVTQYALENANFYGNETLGDYWAWCCLFAVHRDIAYLQESGDAWTCAARTLERAWGDCEDGAILLHSMMLSLGCPPSRIKTVFGKYGIDSIGHVWTIFLRASDGEWIVMDWTATVPSDIEDFPRQSDVLSSYKDVSKVLTFGAFDETTHLRFVETITVAHANGAATLPALVGAASCGPHAAGDASLSALTGTGLCGIVAAASFRGLTGSGTAQQLATAWGAATLAAMVGDGATGAVAAAILSAFTGTGRCGTSASGKANFPAMTGAGEATADALTRGVGILPALTGTGRAFPGAVVAGIGLLPLLIGTGRAKQGPIAHGSASLPRLAGAGHASVLLVGIGSAELSPVIGRGHAINGSASWTGKLSYDPARWA